MSGDSNWEKWDQKRKREGRWDNVDRGLPPNWNKLREQVFERDGYRCTETLPSGKRCPRRRGDSHRTELQCDHIGDRRDHSPENLTTMCKHHHDKKTAQQGVEARERMRNPKKRRARRQEQHPGVVRRADGGAR